MGFVIIQAYLNWEFSHSLSIVPFEIGHNLGDYPKTLNKLLFPNVLKKKKKLQLFFLTRLKKYY